MLRGALDIAVVLALAWGGAGSSACGAAGGDFKVRRRCACLGRCGVCLCLDRPGRGSQGGLLAGLRGAGAAGGARQRAVFLDGCVPLCFFAGTGERPRGSILLLPGALLGRSLPLLGLELQGRLALALQLGWCRALARCGVLGLRAGLAEGAACERGGWPRCRGGVAVAGALCQHLGVRLVFACRLARAGLLLRDDLEVPGDLHGHQELGGHGGLGESGALRVGACFGCSLGLLPRCVGRGLVGGRGARLGGELLPGQGLMLPWRER